MIINFNNFDIFQERALNQEITSKVKFLQQLVSKPEAYYNIFAFDLLKNQRSVFTEHATYISENFSDILFIGMGGSSLNPKTLLKLCEAKVRPGINIYFLDNTDPYYFQTILHKISDLSKCAIIAVSNSGKTAETNSLLQNIIATFKQAGINDFAKCCFCITNNTGKMSEIAAAVSANIIPHMQSISGRFSSFSNVVTFLAQIVGLELDAYWDGAENMLQNFINNGSYHQAIVTSSLSLVSGKPIVVNISYIQRMEIFLEWYCQIIAESLGKNDKAATPIRGLGPNDQHSMMQLYLEGPNDKLYNFFTYDQIYQQPQQYTTNLDDLAQMHDINFQATLKAIIEQGKAVRVISLGPPDEYVAGQLAAFVILEVILAAHIMQVNPFNQPGVALIKNNIADLLAAK